MNLTLAQLRRYAVGRTLFRPTTLPRAIEKLGFVREGTLREDCIVNGEISDSWVFGLLSREWQPASDTEHNH